MTYHLDINNEVAGDLRRRGWTKTQIKAVREHLAELFSSADEYEYEFAGDLRLARASDAAEVAQYNKDQEEGCCGSYDEKISVTEQSGGESETILIGFTYGH